MTTPLRDHAVCDPSAALERVVQAWRSAGEAWVRDKLENPPVYERAAKRLGVSYKTMYRVITRLGAWEAIDAAMVEMGIPIVRLRPRGPSRRQIRKVKVPVPRAPRGRGAPAAARPAPAAPPPVPRVPSARQLPAVGKTPRASEIFRPPSPSVPSQRLLPSAKSAPPALPVPRAPSRKKLPSGGPSLAGLPPPAPPPKKPKGPPPIAMEQSPGGTFYPAAVPEAYKHAISGKHRPGLFRGLAVQLPSGKIIEASEAPAPSKRNKRKADKLIASVSKEHRSSASPLIRPNETWAPPTSMRGWFEASGFPEPDIQGILEYQKSVLRQPELADPETENIIMAVKGGHVYSINPETETAMLTRVRKKDVEAAQRELTKETELFNRANAVRGQKAVVSASIKEIYGTDIAGREEARQRLVKATRDLDKLTHLWKIGRAFHDAEKEGELSSPT